MVKRELVPGAPELYANGKINLAGNFLMLGDVPAAAGELEPISDELSRPGDPWMRWRYAMHLLDARARVALARGEPDLALELVAEEIAAARQHRAPKVEARALELRGRVLVAGGQHGEAGEALRAALSLGGRIEYPPVVWRSHALLAEVARRAGDRPATERHAREVHALVERLARSLPEASLRAEFAGMGRRLLDEPLAAYR
jgi:ATP/maltotriose-dependent transcriptional regulator MalT